jgi:hypothetical protein
MAGGLRFRTEAQLISSLAAGFPATTTTALVTAAQLPQTFNRVGIFAMILVARGASSFQFKDSAGNNLSAIYTLTAAGSTVTLDTRINGDYWWATGPNFTSPNNPLGVGISIAVGAAIVDADIYFAFGA